MIRLAVAFVFVLTAAACSPNKTFGSLCKEANAPSACGQTCDPLPGAPSSCPGGFYCAPNGTCDLQCTPTGGECGDGYACTADGRCVDDSGPGSNGPDANCPAVNFTPMPVTPSIQLVLDQSQSMFRAGIYDDMVSALVGGTGVVTQLEAKAYFGSLLYTCNGGNPALEAVPRALNNAAAIRASIEPKMSGDNTPTREAINTAVASFQTTPPPAGSPPVIVLATDGLPNRCGSNSDDRAAVVQAARNAFTAKVPLYVLAMNITNQHFQDVANAGQGWQPGQPNVKYYQSNNAQELKAAFDTIINGVISCDLTLTSSIDAAQAMNGTVIVNGMTLVYGTDWTLVNGNIIRLLGNACTSLKGNPSSTVSASFPCGSVIF